MSKKSKEEKIKKRKLEFNLPTWEEIMNQPSTALDEILNPEVYEPLLAERCAKYLEDKKQSSN